MATGWQRFAVISVAETGFPDMIVFRNKIWHEGNFEDEKEEYRVGSRVHYREDNSTHSNVHCCSRIQSQPILA